MALDFVVTRMKCVEPAPTGYKRQWVKCKRHGNIANYVYVPFSLSTPVMTMPNCGCSPHYRDKEVEYLDERTALTEMYKQKMMAKGNQ